MRHVFDPVHIDAVGRDIDQPLAGAFEMTIPRDHGFHLDAQACQLKYKGQAEQMEDGVEQGIADAEGFYNRA